MMTAYCRLSAGFSVSLQPSANTVLHLSSETPTGPRRSITSNGVRLIKGTRLSCGSRSTAFSRPWEGIQKASQEIPIYVEARVGQSNGDYASIIQYFVDQQFDLIIAPGYLVADAMVEAAMQNQQTEAPRSF
jgi:hypothetical protein